MPKIFGRTERLILDVLIAEHGLSELYAAVAWLYADKLERFGGAAGEAFEEGRGLGLRMAKLAGKAQEAVTDALSKTNGAALDAAERARRLGL